MERAATERIGFFNGKKRAIQLQHEIDAITTWMHERGVDEAFDAETALAKSRADLASVARESDAAQGRLAQLQQEISNAQAYLIDVRAAADLQDVGLFDFEHPSESSVQLAEKLDWIRKEYKDMVKTGSAVHTASNFMFNQSSAKGERFLKSMSRVLLRAYNAEAENAVKATKAGNLATSKERLERARRQIEKNGTMIDLVIDARYHRLRINEIELAAQHLQVKEYEKQMEREHRAELREQKKAEKELAEARSKYLKEQSHYETMLSTLLERGDLEGASRVREQLDDVSKALEDVDYRQANTRAGYVYVISNIGAFGSETVKIGMTRRLDPMDRVRELGDASVPFRFDVHALFFAQDAVAVEASLHRRFSQQRLNKVNLRREFFAVSPQQVLDALRDEQVEVAEFTLAAAAEEFMQSKAITNSHMPKD